jgi:PAS domain S-box-containing protein
LETKKSEQTIMHTPDGRVWEERGEPVFDDKGNLIGVVEIATDITERARIEDALRESEEKHRVLFESAGDAIFIHDSKSPRMLAVNLQACKQLGYTNAELMAMPTGAVDTQEQSKYVPERVARLMEQGHITFETVHQHKDGSHIPTEVSARCIIWDGQPVIMSICRDITDRKQAEAALQEREENLSVTLHSIGDGVISTDINGLIVNMNPIAEKLCGWDFADAAGNPLTEVFNIINSETKETVADPVKKVLQSGEIVGLANHTVLISKNGNEYQIADSAAPIKNKNGEISGVVLVFSDVTEKYVVQNQIKESEERYHSLLVNLEAGIVVHAPDTSIIMNNPRASELLGLSDNQLRGKTAIDPAWKFVDEDNIPLPIEEYPVNRILTGKKPINQIFGIQQPGTNDITWVSVNGFQALNNTGGISEIVISFLDITDRKQAEDALHNSEAIHSAMISNISDVIGIIGTDGIMKYKSPNIEKWFGWQPHDLVGTDGWLTVHPDDLARIQKEFFTLLEKDNSVKTVEYRYKCKNGSYKPIELTATNLTNDPIIGGVLLNYHDISLRKHADDLLQQTRQNYETFFNTIDEFLFVLDEQGNIIHTNSTVIDRLGYTREELAGLSVLMVHPAERRDEAARIVGEMLNGVSTFCPVPIVTKSGMQIPVETRVSHGVWDGKPALFGVAKDISKVRLSEEKFSKLFHLNPSACDLSDLDNHKYIEVNEAFYALLGFDKNEVIGKTATDLGILTPETINTIMLKADSNGNVTNAEADLIAMNGDIKRVLLSAENIQVQDKKYRFTVVHDITARRKIENQLKESEYLQRSLLENVAVGIVIIDPETRVIERINTFALSLIGESAENIIGRRCHQFICPAQEQSCPVCDKGQDVDNSERVLLRADNTAIPILKTVKRIQIGGKEKLLESFVDISIQKKTEENLLKSNQKFEAIISASPDGIGIVSLDGKIQLMSEKLATMYGYSIEEIAELLGKEIFGFIDLSNHKMLMGNMNKLLTGEKGNKVTEYLAVKKDNSRFYVDVNSNVLLDSNGNPASILFVERDITERRQIEQALQESEKKHRLLIENSHDIIYTLTTDGVFIFVSSAWTALLGHPVNQVSGQLFQQFVHPDDLPGCLVFLQKVKETGQRHEGVEYRVRHTDGTWYWHTSSAVPLRDKDGTVIGFEGTARDITERRQAEAEIKLKNEELYTANSEKDKFFSIIAHDMRSPFNAFLGFTRIMVEELNTMSLEEIRNIVVSMRKSATNLYSLLENLLEWSMMQRGVIAYNPVSIPLALKIKESIELIAGSVKKKEIEINYEIPDDLSAFADVRMVESLIRNLISNAVKFTPKKGKITVSANKTEGNFIKISVRDTGIGMKKELMSNLFRLDEQTGRKGTEGEPSTGLGLIICKDFVEKHGGKIWVESEEGKGSSFYFTMPMNI